jgi:hypothetical protein
MCTATLSAIALLLAAGCSSGEKSAQPSETAQTSTSTSELAPLPAAPTPPGAVEVSPGGVTTKVDVPADATESQYGQACHAAKVWMDGQQGDPKTLVEPFLKTLQAPDAVGPGSFDTPWVKLTPAQQAGVIMAVSGAANGDCE